jgi:hypothetical protein
VTGATTSFSSTFTSTSVEVSWRGERSAADEQSTDWRPPRGRALLIAPRRPRCPVSLLAGATARHSRPPRRQPPYSEYRPHTVGEEQYCGRAL